jgi:hypothetical protein
MDSSLVQLDNLNLINGKRKEGHDPEHVFYAGINWNQSHFKRLSTLSLSVQRPHNHNGWTVQKRSPNPKETVSCNPITPPIQGKMVRETQVQVFGATLVKDLAAVRVSAPPNPISSKKKKPSKATFEEDYSSSESHSKDERLLSDRNSRQEEGDDDDDEEVMPATPNEEQPRKRPADSDDDDYRVCRPDPKKKKTRLGGLMMLLTSYAKDWIQPNMSWKENDLLQRRLKRK